MNINNILICRFQGIFGVMPLILNIFRCDSQCHKFCAITTEQNLVVCLNTFVLSTYSCCFQVELKWDHQTNKTF